jgi:hypothetical protein
MRRVLLLCFLVGCGSSIDDDADLDSDPDLASITDEPDLELVDADTSETALAANAPCTKHRYLHVANWSFVAPLDECVNGVCPNGCWGSQRRTSGFACDYDASQPDFLKTRPGDAPFASYNEIKSLNPHDAAAVAACRTQSGNRKLRTYTVWNGVGWDNEGIAAGVKFAELFGSQQEATPHFWTWYNNARGTYSPMSNISPETGASFKYVKQITARICSATRSGWAGLYFYDGDASGGTGMAAWKREAIIRGMNYCTTH